MYTAIRFCLVYLVVSMTTGVIVQANQLPENFAHLPDDVQALILEYAFFSDQVNDRWGQEAQFASQKAYVKYLDDYLSRSRIDFDSGVVVVETLASSNPIVQLQSAIVTTLLTPEDPNQVDIYSANNIEPNSKPFLLGRVVDQQGQNIQYPWRAKQFADYLINRSMTRHNSEKGVIYRVEIPMVKQRNKVAAKHWMPWVQAASDRFDLPESLILGIIETESAFNSFAVSHANAYGLMQVVPSTAGADVFEKIFQRDDKPSRQYLFNAQNNIMVGSGYLSILRDQYLKGVTHPTSQLYCIISAYNSGTGNVLKAFSSDRSEAVARINALSPADVLWRLRKKHPSAEARRYIEKVLANQKKYVM